MLRERHAAAVAVCAAMGLGACDMGAGGSTSRGATAITSTGDHGVRIIPADDAPPCGNGHVDPSEHCDDGNTISGDGCSRVCLAEQVYHRAPDGAVETCQLLVPFPFEPPDRDTDNPDDWAWYRAKDAQAVARLCAIDLYEDDAVGVCPKIHKTQPALELYDLSEHPLAKDAFEDERCALHQHGRAARKIAKLKTTVFAREAEAGLLYFHLARLLGNGAIVYPATHRTISVGAIDTWSADALRYPIWERKTPRGGWLRIRRLLGWAKPELSDRLIGVRDRLLVPGRTDVVAGSLAKNPRGEQTHDAFNFLDDQRIAMPAEFRHTDYYRLVIAHRSVASSLHLDTRDRDRYGEELQVLAHARDFTHVLMLDYLVHQRDRSGNIHQQTYYHYVDDHGRLRWKRERPAGEAGRRAVPLIRVILKDNDDGLRWDHPQPFPPLTMIDDFRHMDPVAYHRVQWLADLARDPAGDDALRSYFVDAVHVSSEVYDEVRRRLLVMAELLEARFESGDLRLDLDLAAALRGDIE